jgi:hypothetical protein
LGTTVLGGWAGPALRHAGGPVLFGAFLIAIGVVIILGAVVGLVWQERCWSFTAALRNCGGHDRPRQYGAKISLRPGPHPTVAGRTGAGMVPADTP